jgi:hypothetical protein
LLKKKTDLSSAQGLFEILSLSGSFLLSENGDHRSHTGGLSVSLAGPDGRVLGGGVAGLLTAASPVQVVSVAHSSDVYPQFAIIQNELFLFNLINLYLRPMTDSQCCYRLWWEASTPMKRRNQRRRSSS